MNKKIIVFHFYKRYDDLMVFGTFIKLKTSFPGFLSKLYYVANINKMRLIVNSSVFIMQS